jgi:excisionase family DNA binding protein
MVEKNSQTDITEQLRGLAELVDAAGPIMDLLAAKIAMRLQSGAGAKLLYTRQNAADYLDVSVGFIDELRKDGQIERVKVGNRWQYPRESLDAWARRQPKDG